MRRPAAASRPAAVEFAHARWRGEHEGLRGPLVDRHADVGATGRLLLPLVSTSRVEAFSG